MRFPWGAGGEGEREGHRASFLLGLMYPLESLDPLFLTRLDYHWGAGIRRKLKEEGQGPLEKVF